jgi:hypothetical protein
VCCGSKIIENTGVYLYGSKLTQINMRIPYKKLLATGAAVASLLATFTPAALASENTKAQANKNFCANLINRENKTRNTIVEREQKLSTRKAERDARIAKQRTTQDSRLATTRGNGDEQRANQYTRLVGKATTDAQKAAVETYKKTITTAITARRTAVNTAIDTFQAGMDTALAGHKTALDAALALFKTSLATTTEKAKTDCAATTPDTKTIRQNYVKAVQDAHAKLKSDRAAIPGLSAQVNTLTSTRKAAVEKTFADFKTAADAAKLALKAAFGK